MAAKTNKRGSSNLFSLGPPTYLVLIKIQWNSIHKKVFLLQCRDFKLGPPNNLSAYLSIIFPDAANFLGNAKDNRNPPAPPTWFCIKLCVFSYRNLDSCIYFRSEINAQLRTDWWNTLIGKVRTLCGWLPSHPILVAWAVCNMPWVAGWSVKIMDGTSSDASLIQSFVTHSCNALHTGQTLFLIFFQSNCNSWMWKFFHIIKKLLDFMVKKMSEHIYIRFFYRNVRDICTYAFDNFAQCESQRYWLPIVSSIFCIILAPKKLQLTCGVHFLFQCVKPHHKSRLMVDRWWRFCLVFALSHVLKVCKTIEKWAKVLFVKGFDGHMCHVLIRTQSQRQRCNTKPFVFPH